ncbi:MAG: aldolase/citrate lyase family protein [Cytophagales bacterium]|nr:aldolase/citrate lyase family protein [Cytophagales bacterium]
MENQLKQKTNSEDISYGLWNAIPDTYVAEICAGAGYDWIVIDAEHGPFDERTILPQLQAMGAYPNTQVLVRPPSANPVFLKKMLDYGVQSFVIPMIETKEQAEAMVHAVLYPPEGIRGVAPAMARASRWGAVENYAHDANDEICLILQIESRKGIENLEEICKVQGVDGLFIGPADLAASYGYIGDTDHPEIEQIIQDSLKTIRQSGKTAGILALKEEEVQSYMEQGANFIGIGVDLLMLVSQVRGTIEKYKQG